MLKMFPYARFVYVVRNPYAVIRSTLNLYRSLYHVYRVGDFTEAGLEDFVINMFLQMNKKLDETKGLIPEGYFHEVRYEKLIENPEREMQRVYESLDLGCYESNLQQSLVDYFADRSGFKPNVLEVEPDLCQTISSELGDIIKQYGYEVQSETEPSS